MIQMSRKQKRGFDLKRSVEAIFDREANAPTLRAAVAKMDEVELKTRRGHLIRQLSLTEKGQKVLELIEKEIKEREKYDPSKARGP